MQDTNFVYFSYTKIVQIKTLYDNECTRNVCQTPTYIQKMYKLHKTCTKFRLNTKFQLTAWNLKCVFYTYKKCTNYTKPIQLANWNGLCMFSVHTSNVQNMQNLYN